MPKKTLASAKPRDREDDGLSPMAMYDTYDGAGAVDESPPTKTTTKATKVTAPKTASKPSAKAVKASPTVATAPAKTSKKTGKVKKPLGKQAKVLAQWTGESRSAQLDQLMLGIVNEARKTTGHEGIMTSDDSLLLGLPFPSFCWEYLTRNSHLPLSIFIRLIGLPGTNKSSLAFEIMRWFFEYGGLNVFIENESKFSTVLFKSILNYAKRAAAIEKSESVEDWQRKLTYHTERLQKFMLGTKEAPGPGRIIPTCFVVDSLTGKEAEEVGKNIDEKGFAGKGHPVGALSTSRFLGTYPSKLVGWPFLFLATAHNKPKKENGIEIDQMQGGHAPTFYETMRFKLKRGKSVSFEKTEGREITIQCVKNSLGAGDKAIKARFLWKNEVYYDKKQQKNRQRQVSWWDWKGATTYLLADRQASADDPTSGGVKVSVAYRNELKDICDVKLTNRGDATAAAYSKKLGLPNKEDAIPVAEMGALIDGNTEVIEQLRDFFGVHEVQRFNIERDFNDQLEDLRQYTR